MNNWNNFTIEFTNNILNIYKEHELTFDTYKIHGCLHISRSIIFSEFMCRYYNEIGIKVDFDAIRYAVSFHDSGRKGNGVDIWEKDSCNICYLYLSSKFDSEYSKYISELIIKRNMKSDINKLIVTDSDVLEIMRPICGHGGINGFNSKYLNFSTGMDNFREELINESWQFIEYTENSKQYFNCDNTLNKLIDYLKINKKKYPLLSRYF